MADKQDQSIIAQSELVITGEHPTLENSGFMVAPSHSKENRNKVRPAIMPVACWKVEDICFDFDRAFVRKDAKDAFQKLAELRERHPKSPISIFGHADPVGEDPYNKRLSEDRAKAIYGALTRNVKTWQEIYGKKEDVRFLQNRLTSLGQDPGQADGIMGSKTRAAIMSYMDELCGEFKLEDSDFLGNGQCAFQGCSEYNPLRMFSREMTEYFKDKERKAERDRENQPNRRVTAFFFRRGIEMDPSKWPCPSASKGVEGCKNRFWSDWQKRREFQQDAREFNKPGEFGKVEESRGETKKGDTGSESRFRYKLTNDTFACRFYERQASLSPCEQPAKLPPVQVVLEMYVLDHQNARVAGKYKVAKSSEIISHGAVDKEGLAEGSRGKFTTESLQKDKYKDKTLEIINQRLQVMKRTKPPFEMTAAGPIPKPLGSDSIGYHEDYYPTERQFMSYAVYTNPDAFKKAYKSGGKKGGPGKSKKLSFRQNRVLILWNDEKHKVDKYILDGEELDAEHDDSVAP
jgi:hypothetical protein